MVYASFKHFVAPSCIILAAILYMLGIGWPLLLLTLGLFTAVLPMPRVANSWLSRAVISLLLVYALLQIAAVLQFLIHPAGKFKLIAVIYAVLAALILTIFGKLPSKTAWATSKDIFAAIGCLFFIIPLTPVIIGNHKTETLVRTGATQIQDAVSHIQLTSTTLETENLTYKAHDSYPVGFHIATAFVEKSFVKDIQTANWKTHASMFLWQYMLFGALLGYCLIYLAYLLAERIFGKALSITSTASLALAVGGAVTLLYLFLFMMEGFLNYYYVCSALIVCLYYVFDTEWQNGNGALDMNTIPDKWPLVAYLVVGLGVAYSWTIFIPIILAIFIIWILPLSMAGLKGGLKQLFRISNVTVVIGLLLYLLALYFQIHYYKNDANSLKLSGAIQSFNLILLLLGVIVSLCIVHWKKLDNTFKRNVTGTVLPYLTLIAGLMTLQYFLLGEARYYLIKSAMPLDMIFLALSVAGLTYIVMTKSILEGFLKFATITSVVLIMTLISIGIADQPLKEIRELFRNYSGIGQPPFFENDSKAVAKLADQNKLDKYNMTILHYNQDNNRLYAHIEMAQWANAMGTIGIHDVCFGNQYAALAYNFNDSPGQAFLLQEVKKCAVVAKQNNLHYYIVTDQASASHLQELFGDNVTLVY